jgi:thiamine-phosphate pyrophosphorylase
MSLTRATRYAITDGTAALAPAKLLEQIALLVRHQAIDRLQIREKSLSARELLAFTQRVVSIAKPSGIEVLVNERADIALAAGADGVHLTSLGLSPSTLRRLGIRRIGVSCHNQQELARAQEEDVDFAVLSPVFSPLSKQTEYPPLGLQEFGRLARTVKIPVLALGGVTLDHTQDCLDAGAAGIAGITLFQRFVS